MNIYEVMMAWMTIESAPKNGDRINLAGNNWVRDGYWDGNYWVHAIVPSYDCNVAEYPDTEPTHWKPLENHPD